MLIHVQFFIDQHSQAKLPSSRLAMSCCMGLFCPRHSTVHFLLLNFEVFVSLFLQAVTIALNCLILGSVGDHPCPFGIICQLAGSVLCLIVQAINSNVRWYWCQYWSLRDAITNWTPAGVHIADHNPWSPAVQAIFHPPYSLLIQLISHWFG